MAAQTKAGNRTQLNTLTAARRALCLDDLRMISDLTKFLEVMIAEHPEEVVEHFFGSWLRATCIEVDEGTRKGSSTANMLKFYADQADGLRHRIAEASEEPKI